jgi:aspartyl-tRNA(Asn)/glutamyl-tRNA(Gln) amidotransferase subunit C
LAQATLEIVEQVARLARLSLTQDEKESFTRQLDRILDYAQSIQTLDVASIPPMSHAAASTALREDEDAPGLDRGTVLEAAPDVGDGLFRVPKILG